MPANLNALIRYKQIDRELKNPYLRTTIKSLQKACSEQLAEHRGVYKLISERTIRDDIRVMRSEALDFNAPIVVENGVYSYSDKNYSIFNTVLEDKSLLLEIWCLLITEKSNIKSPEIHKVILELELKLKNLLPPESESSNINSLFDRKVFKTNLGNTENDDNYAHLLVREEKTEASQPSLDINLKPFNIKSKIKKDTYLWTNILELL